MLNTTLQVPSVGFSVAGLDRAKFGFYRFQSFLFIVVIVTSTKKCILTNFNRPFPSSKKSHFESEAKCEAIDMKMIFNYDANKTHFHNKGFALSLVLKVRFFGTRKWPIHSQSPVKSL